MIALADILPSPKAESSQDDRKKQDDQESVPAHVNATPAQRPAENSRGFAGRIKQLFREVKEVLTGRDDPAPEPKKRRRSGETWATFRMAAQKLLQHVIALPALAYFAAYMSDNPLDPTNPYWSIQSDDDPNADFKASDHNHLFPHL